MKSAAENHYKRNSIDTRTQIPTQYKTNQDVCKQHVITFIVSWYRTTRYRAVGGASVVGKLSWHVDMLTLAYLTCRFTTRRVVAVKYMWIDWQIRVNRFLRNVQRFVTSLAKYKQFLRCHKLINTWFIGVAIRAQYRSVARKTVIRQNFSSAESDGNIWRANNANQYHRFTVQRVGHSAVVSLSWHDNTYRFSTHQFRLCTNRYWPHMRWRREWLR